MANSQYNPKILSFKNVLYVTRYEESETAAASSSSTIESMIEAFENAHPGIKVEMTMYGVWSFEDKLIVETSNGYPWCDVILSEGILLLEYTTQDLTPYIENGDIDTSTYSDAAEKMKVYTYTEEEEKDYLQNFSYFDSEILPPAEFFTAFRIYCLQNFAFIYGTADD